MFKSRRVKQKTKPNLKAVPLTPMQVARAYNFPIGVDVSKRTVAILELGGSFQLSDVVSYCARYGLTPPQITTLFVDGAAAQMGDADGEVCLDIDIIATVAPGAKIVVVFAPNTTQGFIDGIKACLDINPDAISISWGGPENTWNADERASLDALFLQAEERGINVFAASGDDGSSDGIRGGSHCDYPASSPYVISCGGTRLTLNEDGTRATEVAWANGGGGVSKLYDALPWQAGTAPDQKPGRRSPDVSGNADPDSGYLVDIDGEIQQTGGTSAVAPLYAALQLIINAMAGAHVGNMHSKLYANRDCFFDVTSGSNGAYHAGSGYDVVTGLGVLDFNKFFERMKASYGPKLGNG